MTDRAELGAALGHRLRQAGIPVTTSSVVDFAHALDELGTVSRPSVYWAARLTMVDDARWLATFDRVIAEVLDAACAPRQSRAASPESSLAGRAVNVPITTTRSGSVTGESLPWIGPAAGRARASHTGGRTLPEQGRASTEPGSGDLPFPPLDRHDLRSLELAWHQSSRQWPRRRSRRLAPSTHGGRVALRDTLERARATGFEVVEVHRRRTRPRERRLVLLCDVSRSMRPYSSAFLELMHVVAGNRHHETFAFATTVTRLTPVLARNSVDAAVDAAQELVIDRYGGTRIAGSLRDLLRSHHADVLRGAICVIASDGWDGDEPDQLARQMRRLRRRAHRVVWMNPRASTPGFTPTAAGMAAALPSCDVLVPAGTPEDLRRAVGSLGAMVTSTTSRAPRAGSD